MALKQSAMGHIISMMNDTRRSIVVKAISTVDIRTMVRIRVHLDVHVHVHHIHGNNVSEHVHFGVH